MTAIGLLNNEGSKLYMDGETDYVKEYVFKTLAGRSSKNYKHSGVLWWEDWKEVSKDTKGGFFKGTVLTEADINFSTDIYKVCDVISVLNTVVKAGAVVIAIIVVTEAAPVVVANIQGIAYYCKAFGVVEGLNMFRCMGMQGVPDGIISVLQTDLQDGDSDFADIIQYADNVFYSDENIWSESAIIRGNKADVLLGNNLCHNFPIIDKLEGTMVTSIKSIHLSMKTYQTRNGLYNVLAKYIRQLDGFIGKQWNGIEVKAVDYNTKVLQVAVPDFSFTEAQKLALESAKVYASERNIKLVVTVIKTY